MALTFLRNASRVPPAAGLQLSRCAASTVPPPQICATPPKALVTETINITVTGLSSNKVTLHLSISEPYATFSSLGHFYVDAAGCVKVAEHASYGGTYTGCDAMGLFWSLKEHSANPRGYRLLRREAERPLAYTLSAIDGHVSWQQLLLMDEAEQQLCSTSIERTYLSPSVQRLPVRFGRIRGSLFRPVRSSQLPAILDVFGTNGGVMEHRAALLANAGYCVLALAFFKHDDLPQQLLQVELDYFEEAVEFLASSQYSNGRPIGLIGTSAGADIVAQLSILLRHKIAATVWINGCHCHCGLPMVYRGQRRQHFLEADYDEAVEIGTPPSIDMRPVCHPDCDDELLLPLEQATSQFLLISCLDDCANPPQAGLRLAERLRRKGAGSRCQHVTYADAGHLLEPPFGPCCPICYHGHYKVQFYYGGRPAQHNAAQLDSWQRILAFFNQHVAKAVAKL